MTIEESLQIDDMHANEFLNRCVFKTPPAVWDLGILGERK